MTNLPVSEVLDQLTTALTQYDEVVLEAPPGAGKTTLVPLELLKLPIFSEQKILMLEPRRLAARMAAARMAEMLGEDVGQRVGYRVRMDSRISAETRIEVVTEGILTRMLQDDPSLDDYGLVIFDEFHERSLDADFGLALALQGRELFRDDNPLKLLLMSATLDKRVIEQLLPGAPLVSSQGRMYPVDICYLGSAKDQRLELQVARAVHQALAEESGSILVFLPGQREIRNVARQLSGELAPDVILTPLYGDLSILEQQRAIQPAPAGQRKIVLATNIAETSLTIEGVRVVVDAGLSREARLDPASGMTRLHTCKVSRAASIQRAGRAGRMEPGRCYRLWSEAQQDQLARHTNPEILTTDLTALALQLARWGVDDPSELSWLNPPPPAALAQGRDLLIRLGALQQTENGYSLTDAGEQMSQLPLHPRLAHLILIGRQYGQLSLACNIAALLSERDPLSGDSDFSRRLAWLKGDISCSKSQQGALHRIRQLSKQYRNIAGKRLSGTTVEALPIPEPDLIAALLAEAYPDRIAVRRKAGGRDYQLSGGRSVRLAEADPLLKHDWLAVANSGGIQGQSADRIYLAAPLDESLFSGPLAELVTEHKVVEWDRKQERMCCEQQRRIGVLVISSRELSKPPLEEKNRALIALLRKQGLHLLPWTPAINEWRQRVNFLAQHQSNGQWPDLSDKKLLDSLEEWLMPWLDQVSHINHFARLDLAGILQGMLPWPLPQQLDQLAPTRIKLPSGHSAAIDYSCSPPVLAVKLQEMLGCTETPAIANGVALMIHLLSPARRPLAVTQDLASFWVNAYPDVKKDMKGRYPKHQWPDNPLEAIPSDGIKRKKRT